MRFERREGRICRGKGAFGWRRSGDGVGLKGGV